MPALLRCIEFYSVILPRANFFIDTYSACRNTRTLFSALPGAARGCWAVTSAPSHGHPCQNSTEEIISCRTIVCLGLEWCYSSPCRYFISSFCSVVMMLCELAAPGGPVRAQELSSQEQSTGSTRSSPSPGIRHHPGGKDRLGQGLKYAQPGGARGWEGQGCEELEIGSALFPCKAAVTLPNPSPFPHLLLTSGRRGLASLEMDGLPPALPACSLSQVTSFTLLASGMAWQEHFTEEKM